jgi:hypothetical protein
MAWAQPKPLSIDVLYRPQRRITGGNPLETSNVGTLLKNRRMAVF